MAGKQENKNLRKLVKNGRGVIINIPPSCLNKAGLVVGDYVNVDYSAGKIVITTAKTKDIELTKELLMAFIECFMGKINTPLSVKDIKEFNLIPGIGFEAWWTKNKYNLIAEIALTVDYELIERKYPKSKTMYIFKQFLNN